MKQDPRLPLPQEGLEKKLGHTFRDPALLKLALSHSSYANEQHLKNPRSECNERLEFFGDSILSFLVSDYLYRHYRDVQEGDLTKIRASVVCERALAKYAAQIGLGDYLLLGRGEDTPQGRSRASITSDAFEAVLAADVEDRDIGDLVTVGTARYLVTRWDVSEANDDVKKVSIGLRPTALQAPQAASAAPQAASPGTGSGEG